MCCVPFLPSLSTGVGEDGFPCQFPFCVFDDVKMEFHFTIVGATTIDNRHSTALFDGS